MRSHTVGWLSSFALRLLICACSFSICPISSFLTTLSRIALALSAYFSVERLSSRLATAGDTVASIEVREFPPRDSYQAHISMLTVVTCVHLPINNRACRTLVSLLFRKGTNIALPVFELSVMDRQLINDSHATQCRRYVGIDAVHIA